MTQPQQKSSWVQDVLNRYLGNDAKMYQRKTPVGFEFERAPFDPSSYYGELSNIKRISQAGTQLLNQRLANQRAMEAQAMQQGIPGSPGMISPGGSQQAPGGKFGSKQGAGFGSPLGNYRQTSGYGPRNAPTAGASSYHRGVDLAAAAGTPIYATHSGYVSSAGWNARSGYGWSVTLNAGNGVQTFYGHNSSNTVRPGQYVQRGQVIGYVGSTGISTGPHLHYGVLVNGNWVNPAGYY